MCYLTGNVRHVSTMIKSRRVDFQKESYLFYLELPPSKKFSCILYSEINVKMDRLWKQRTNKSTKVGDSV